MTPASAAVLIDGLNVAYWCGAPPSLRLPLSLLHALLNTDHTCLLCFDASTPYQLPAEERPIWQALIAHPALAMQVPSGQSADDFLLRLARDCGGRILSRDRFRDHRRKFRRLIADPTRRIDGAVEADTLRVPALDLATPLSASAADAWARLQTQPDCAESHVLSSRVLSDGALPA